MRHDPESRILRRLAVTKLPTKWGEFQAIGFQQEICNGSRRFESAVALIMGEPAANVPLVRIHSQCLTGDAFGSLRCDCGEQLELAMDAISSENCGLLIYEHQEGRGIGLMAARSTRHSFELHVGGKTVLQTAGLVKRRSIRLSCSAV
jgi:GTP cyclohydrolase II